MNLVELVTNRRAGRAGWWATEQLLTALSQPGFESQMVEFLQGGFLVLHDGGDLYDSMGKRDQLDGRPCRTRLSSHSSASGYNYRCPIGTSQAAILVGNYAREESQKCEVRTDGDSVIGNPLSPTPRTGAWPSAEERCSWVQLEGASMHHAADILQHALDYAKYKLQATPANTGPGLYDSRSSEFTEHTKRLHFFPPNVIPYKIQKGAEAKDYESILSELRPDMSGDLSRRRTKTRRRRLGVSAAATAAALLLAHRVYEAAR